MLLYHWLIHGDGVTHPQLRRRWIVDYGDVGLASDKRHTQDGKSGVSCDIVACPGKRASRFEACASLANSHSRPFQPLKPS